MKGNKLKQYDIKHIFLSSMATIRYVSRYPYFVTGKGHRKIEPKAKNFSHCKKDQSSKPNQTDNSKRLAKIT